MELKGKKVGVLVDNIYEDLELWYPTLRLREAGADVFIIGAERTVYKSKHGYEATADIAAADVHGEDFDAIIIPGGYAPDHMRRHKEMVDIVKDAFNHGACVAAICHGGWMLCSARVINGKKLTGFYAIKDDLENAGATFIDEEVVVDGNLVTSRTPMDLPAFCRAIIETIAG